MTRFYAFGSIDYRDRKPRILYLYLTLIKIIENNKEKYKNCPLPIVHCKSGHRRRRPSPCLDGRRQGCNWSSRPSVRWWGRPLQRLYFSTWPVGCCSCAALVSCPAWGTWEGARSRRFDIRPSACRISTCIYIAADNDSNPPLLRLPHLPTSTYSVEAGKRRPRSQSLAAAAIATDVKVMSCYGDQSPLGRPSCSGLT